MACASKYATAPGGYRWLILSHGANPSGANFPIETSGIEPTTKPTTCSRALQNPFHLPSHPITRTMSSSPRTPGSSSQFKSILIAALNEYRSRTGNDLLNNSLAKELQSCESVEAVLDIIQRESMAIDKFRDGDKRLMKWIGPLVNVLYTVSSILGAGVSIVRTIRNDLRCVVIVVQPFPPGGAVFTGIGILLVVRSSVFLFAIRPL